ncbi:uncharacterized protein PHALS_02660 [Plasmopara halstedii]|uniref:Uncharacterized protein n=1 Tax=Plasmopara halstedii TaxID=4781 RepID=A0A0P1AYL4_PLAHL|nr:uncharacterized protein PHALS_02660 [Plasmopara halstedii]CEG46247.1 hypothetical protein PHALS_02660 [Plasmopara halstedii]|eukprot:XP_024582616.1 hypothetical protein PHALS_02660 [Plasmopara halstedii]
MDRLLNDAPPEDANDEIVIKSEVTLAPSALSPSTSAASLGLRMLSMSAAASSLRNHPSVPPRLPPISLLTSAAATMRPTQYQSIHMRAPPQKQFETSLPPASACQGTLIDMMCRYRNKKCGYPRAIKRNGERHNLCERHRAKANQNQRKLESKRRTQKRMMQRTHSIGIAKTTKLDALSEINCTFYSGMRTTGC